MRTFALIEALDLTNLTEADVDRDKRTVKQRLISVGESANRTVYNEPVLKEAAPLFEGVKCYANHPSASEQKDRPERSIRDITGWITEPIFEGDGVYGTRHFTKTQAGQDAWNIVEQILAGEAPPSLMGGSINAFGKGKKQDGKVIVESIAHVNSVDDVTTPAAGGAFVGLVAGGAESYTAELLSQMDYMEWFECRPEFTERLKNECKTVRQDNAVKAATTEAHQHAETVIRMQESLAVVQSERDAVVLEAEQIRRELAIEKMLRKAGLPATWEVDLRTRLMESDPGKWEGIVQTEVSKAKRADALPKVAVSGAGQRVAAPVKLQELRTAVLPRDNEDAESWAQRLRSRSNRGS